jgi:hypothetical protein
VLSGVTVFYFEKTGIEPAFFLRLGGFFIINTSVKGRKRVRLGYEERLDLCERSRAEIFVFFAG